MRNINQNQGVNIRLWIITKNLKLPTKHWLTCIESINLKWVSLEKYSECAIVEHTCTCAQIIFNIDLHGESEREKVIGIHEKC